MVSWVTQQDPSAGDDLVELGLDALEDGMVGIVCVVLKEV